ncbi:MAG: class I SAM-dependent methyltransferase [Desulfobacterales bacterium]
MAHFIWICLIAFFLLFAGKMAYLASAACALPKTGGALYVSTSLERIHAAIAALPAGITTAVDLGCGDGRVLRTFSRTCGAACIGYEINLLAYFKARLLCRKFRRISIRRQNFWQADLSSADVVFCYLFPDVTAKLADKLKSELPSGAAIVSFNFPLPGLSPNAVIYPEGPLHHDPIFLYRRP